MFTKRERWILILWLLSWLIVPPVIAQVRAGLFKTLVTTDTTANSLIVGGAAGGTSGTGGIKAGPIVATTGTFSGAVSGTTITGSSTVAGVNGTFSGTLTATGTGNHTIGAGGTSAGSALIVNGGNLSGAGGQLLIEKNNGSIIQIGHKSAVFGSGTASDLAVYAPASSGIGFFTNNSSSERWGINSAGDLTFGASSHIALSSGTPTINSGFGGSATIGGTDYAAIVTLSGSASTTGAINFGHTWTTAPICTASGSSQLGTIFVVPVTTRVDFTYTSTTVGVLYVLCHGY